MQRHQATSAQTATVGVAMQLPRRVNSPSRLVPSSVAPTMIAMAIRAAIRPYSMAAAPSSSRMKERMVWTNFLMNSDRYRYSQGRL